MAYVILNGTHSTTFSWQQDTTGDWVFKVGREEAVQQRQPALWQGSTLGLLIRQTRVLTAPCDLPVR